MRNALLVATFGLLVAAQGCVVWHTDRVRDDEDDDLSRRDCASEVCASRDGRLATGDGRTE